MDRIGVWINTNTGWIERELGAGYLRALGRRVGAVAVAALARHGVLAGVWRVLRELIDLCMYVVLLFLAWWEQWPLLEAVYIAAPALQG